MCRIVVWAKVKLAGAQVINLFWPIPLFRRVPWNESHSLGPSVTHALALSALKGAAMKGSNSLFAGIRNQPEHSATGIICLGYCGECLQNGTPRLLQADNELFAGALSPSDG